MDALTPPNMLQAAQPNPQAMMAQALQPVPKPVTHDVTIVTTKKLAQAKVMGVPPEEFGIERGARSIQDCNYCFHEVVTKTAAQLIAEGFDKTQIKALTEYTGLSEIETIERDTVAEHLYAGTAENSSVRPVKITEHYVRMDYEGNGRPCLYMVVTGGDQGEILKKDGKPLIEPIDVIPFAATTPVPQTHRFFGRSMADLVMDIQRIKTALLRAALDSKYLSAGADIEIAESHVGASTIDDLLGPKRPGRIVRTKQPGGLNYQVVPDTSESSFGAMTYLDAIMEARTGLAKQSQGLDANALQNQSATAVAQVFSASQMRVKLIARIMAEGVRQIFSLLHHTIRSHGQEQQTVRLRNQWVPIDPRQWKTRNDMTINVGLGSGGKAQQFAQMMALANFQKELILGGKGHMVGDDKIFATATELTKILGHKNPDRFFDDPTETDESGQLKHPPQPPPEDPKVTALKIQAQLDEKADERKAQIETVQAQADIATQDKKIQAEMAQTDREFELKAKLAMMQAQLDAELKAKEEARKEREFEQKMAFEREKHQATMSQTAMGMVATAHSHDAKMEQNEAAHEAKMAAAKPKADK
jgi:hypothetical protein